MDTVYIYAILASLSVVNIGCIIVAEAKLKKKYQAKLNELVETEVFFDERVKTEANNMVQATKTLYDLRFAELKSLKDTLESSFEDLQDEREEELERHKEEFLASLEERVSSIEKEEIRLEGDRQNFDKRVKTAVEKKRAQIISEIKDDAIIELERPYASEQVKEYSFAGDPRKISSIVKKFVASQPDAILWLNVRYNNGREEGPEAQWNSATLQGSKKLILEQLDFADDVAVKRNFKWAKVKVCLHKDAKHKTKVNVNICKSCCGLEDDT